MKFRIFIPGTKTRTFNLNDEASQKEINDITESIMLTIKAYGKKDYIVVITMDETGYVLKHIKEMTIEEMIEESKKIKQQKNN